MIYIILFDHCNWAKQAYQHRYEISHDSPYHLSNKRYWLIAFWTTSYWNRRCFQCWKSSCNNFSHGTIIIHVILFKNLFFIHSCTELTRHTHKENTFYVSLILQKVRNVWKSKHKQSTNNSRLHRWNDRVHYQCQVYLSMPMWAGKGTFCKHSGSRTVMT